MIMVMMIIMGIITLMMMPRRTEITMIVIDRDEDKDSIGDDDFNGDGTPCTLWLL